MLPTDSSVAPSPSTNRPPPDSSLFSVLVSEDHGERLVVARKKPMRRWMSAGTLVFAVLIGALVSHSQQRPVVRTLDEAALREYAGVYQWAPDAFVYLQLWKEFTGFTEPGQLVAFDETSELRTLYPIQTNRFFAGPGAAVPASVESRIE